MVFNMTAGAEHFSVVDVKDAFCCMQVKKQDQHISWHSPRIGACSRTVARPKVFVTLLRRWLQPPLKR